jgi:hypothetical protein
VTWGPHELPHACSHFQFPADLGGHTRLPVVGEGERIDRAIGVREETLVDRDQISVLREGRSSGRETAVVQRGSVIARREVRAG